MIRGGHRWIAPMVGGKNQKIVKRQLAIKRWKPAVEFFQCAGVTFDVIAVTVELVEIDQVDEEQASVKLVERAERLGHAIGVVLGLFVVLNAAAQKHVEDLADT